jgi:hypothetical protein
VVSLRLCDFVKSFSFVFSLLDRADASLEPRLILDVLSISQVSESSSAGDPDQSVNVVLHNYF